jgi:hypothetical protein
MRRSDWEWDFRRQVVPQLESGSPRIIVDLRERTSGAAHGRVNDAERIMSQQGYKLVESEFEPIGDPIPGMMMRFVATWGTLTFGRSGSGATPTD